MTESLECNIDLPDNQYQIIVKNGDELLIYQIGDDETTVKTEIVDDNEIIYEDSITYEVEYTIKEEECDIQDEQVLEPENNYELGIPNEGQIDQDNVDENESSALDVLNIIDKKPLVYMMPITESTNQYVLDTPCIQIKDEMETEDATEELMRHLETQHGDELEGVFQCHKCNIVFTSKSRYLQHQTELHTRRVFAKREDKVKYKEHYKKVCETCGKYYYSRAALNYHQRVHTGEKPYACTECPKAFTMPLFLQIHLRTHTGERPYQCPKCPKAFSNQAAVMRHDRVHTGIKPYPCLQCGKRFTQSNSMKLHVRTVHMKLPAPYKRNKRQKMQPQDAE